MARRRVLVIEDSPVSRAVAERVLAATDRYVVRAVRSLAEAQHVAEEEAVPHVVILDLNLPDSRGLQSAQRVRQMFPAAQLIVWTGEFLSVEDRVALARMGSEAYLKTMAPTDIWQVLRAMEEQWAPANDGEHVPSWMEGAWRQARERLAASFVVVTIGAAIAWLASGLLEHARKGITEWLGR